MKILAVAAVTAGGCAELTRMWNIFGSIHEFSVFPEWAMQCAEKYAISDVIRH